jgi:hypothetical protein
MSVIELRNYEKSMLPETSSDLGDRNWFDDLTKCFNLSYGCETNISQLLIIVVGELLTA